jgi:hypothetical protein
MAVANPFVAAELYIQKFLSRLPHILSRWLGYRAQKLSPSPLWAFCFWSFTGAFGGIGMLFAVFGHTDYFTVRNAPPIVASFVSASSLLTIS